MNTIMHYHVSKSSPSKLYLSFQFVFATNILFLCECENRNMGERIELARVAHDEAAQMYTKMQKKSYVSHRCDEYNSNIKQISKQIYDFSETGSVSFIAGYLFIIANCTHIWLIVSEIEGENKVVILRILCVVNSEAKGKYQHVYHHKTANLYKAIFL